MFAGKAWAFEGNPKKVKELSIEAFVRVYESQFHSALKTFNKDIRDNPQEYFGKIGKKEVASYLQKHKIERLPKLQAKGLGYESRFQGHRIFISPRLAYQGKILFDQTALTIKGKSYNELLKEFHLLTKNKKFSFLSLFIQDAHAIGPLAFGVYLGITAGIGYLVADDGVGILNGDLESVDEVLTDMTEKKNQCHTDIRAIGQTASKAAPGEQETFKDMKKIEDALKATRRYDIHIASENKDLHTLIFREFYGKDVDSCQDFGRQWESKAGALSQRDQEGINRVRSNASEKTRKICEVVDTYAGCLYKMRKVSALHQGQRRNGYLYNEETGLYRDQTFTERALDIIGR
jgi:hypothetical protein